MSKTSEELKEMVKERYSQIAGEDLETIKGSCCGTSCGCNGEEVDFSLDYSKLEGYVKDADLALGCGIPIEHAGLFKGAIVVDLGSGAGNDVFVARQIVGKEGEVIGVDMTDKMLERANKNKEKLGFENVRFLKGEIESLPLKNNVADVIISNCVLNLVPDKQKAFDEIFRVTKPGGHFCISDIVLKGNIPSELKEVAELYAGCISGAISEGEYLGAISKAGFTETEIKTKREIHLPHSLLIQFMTEEEFRNFRSSGAGIFSITVKAIKPIL